MRVGKVEIWFEMCCTIFVLNVMVISYMLWVESYV